MEVNIGELSSTLRALDGESVLVPETLKKIVGTVMKAVEEREEHLERVNAEQRLGAGLSSDLEEG